MKRLSRVVKIANPRNEGKRYTSARRAAEFVRRGIAVYEQNGKEASIRFIDDPSVRRLKQMELREAIARSTDVDIERLRQTENDALIDGSILAARNGHFWWNGCDPLEPSQQYHREPGRAPQFPRPDQFIRFPKWWTLPR